MFSDSMQNLDPTIRLQCDEGQGCDALWSGRRPTCEGHVTDTEIWVKAETHHFKYCTSGKSSNFRKVVVLDADEGQPQRITEFAGQADNGAQAQRAEEEVWAVIVYRHIVIALLSVA